MKPLTNLFLGGGVLRPLLTLLSCVLALLFGFVWVDPAAAGMHIIHWGYWYIATVFLCFVVCLCLRFREEWPGLPALLREHRWSLVLLLLLSVFMGFADRVCYKVLFDEPCLQTTAMHMHQAQEVGTISGGVVHEGRFLTTEVFLDKRPYFYAFLVSVLHGLLGFREGNAFLLNLLLIPVLLVVTYAVALRFAERRGAMLSVVLLATLPILIQCATGAGMDFHNLVMIAVCFWASLSYLDKPEPLRLSVLCLAAVLLTQSRYESALFVVSIGLVIVLGWLRSGRAVWSWFALLTPLLLVPYAWHNKYLSTIPALWQLKPGQSVRFSTDYLWGNLGGALHFFFNFGTSLPNSPQLTLLGCLAVLVLVFLAARRLRGQFLTTLPAAPLTLFFFALVAGLNFLVLQFYYWAKLDDYLACRFSLPLYWILALCVALALGRLAGELPRLERWVMLVVSVFFFGFTVPTLRKAEYTEKNLVAKELVWEKGQLAGYDRNRLFLVTNKSTLPWIVVGVSSVILDQDPVFWNRLGQYRLSGEVPVLLVSQTLRAATPESSFVLDSAEVLPPGVELETVAELTLGLRKDRLSRIVSIAVEKPLATAGKP